MPELTQHAASLHESLGENGQRISLEVVEKVLRAIRDRHPDLKTEAFDAMRDHVRDTLVTNIALVNSGMFPLVIMADLEEDGTLPKETIPEKIDVPQAAIDKLTALGVMGKNRAISAYIILHATSLNDLDKKMGAAHFGADATQFLMPMFHALMEHDSSVKDALLSELAQLEGYKIMLTLPGVVDEYFFTRGNNQPYVLLTMEHGDAVPEEARNEVYETFVKFMLKTIKEHIAS